MPTEIGAYEAKTHLPALLERVARGEWFTITKHGRPIARRTGPDRRRDAIERLKVFRERRAHRHPDRCAVRADLRLREERAAGAQRGGAALLAHTGCRTAAVHLADAEHAGAIRAQLERAGTPIGHYDLLITAQARRHGATLVTANQRELARVPGLDVMDWATP